MKIENQGFLLTSNGKELQATVAELRARKQETMLLLRNPGQTNESREAIKLACETLDNPNISTHNLLKNPEMMLTGAKLNTLSQATAYKMLRVLKMRKYVKRKKTINIINLTKENVHGRHGIKLLEKDIWKGMRQKDLAKTTQNFLWMAIHDAYMIGNNWLRPEYAAEYQRRSECQTCIQIETMDHILTDCTATGQSEIWALVDALWTKKYVSPPSIKPDLGNIFGSPGVTFRHEINDGKTRLYRILMAESAHLIWRLRCERVIQTKGKCPLPEKLKTNGSM